MLDWVLLYSIGYCYTQLENKVFPVVMYGCESWTIKLSDEELMFLNSGLGEDY